MPPPNPFDHIAIQQTLANYCIALDTKNFALLSDVFTPDVHAKYPFRDAITGCDAVSAAIQGRLGSIATHHSLTTQHISIDADGAHASAATHFIGAHFGRGEHDGKVLTAYGRYLDRLVCVGEAAQGEVYRRWRIERRDVEFVKRIGDENIMEH